MKFQFLNGVTAPVFLFVCMAQVGVGCVQNEEVKETPFAATAINSEDWMKKFYPELGTDYYTRSVRTMEEYWDDFKTAWNCSGGTDDFKYAMRKAYETCQREETWDMTKCFFSTQCGGFQPYQHGCTNPDITQYNGYGERACGSLIDHGLRERLQANLLGQVRRVERQTDGVLIEGWACVKNIDTDIALKLYAGEKEHGGTHLWTARPQRLERAMQQGYCDNGNGGYHYSTVVPEHVLSAHSGARLYAYGAVNLDTVRSSTLARIPIIPPCPVSGQCFPLFEFINTIHTLASPAENGPEVVWKLCDLTPNCWSDTYASIGGAINNTVTTIGDLLSPMWNGYGSAPNGPEASPAPTPTSTPAPQTTPTPPKCQPGQWRDQESACHSGIKVKTSCPCRDGDWASGNRCHTNYERC